jgi:hypothetical protein
VTEVGEPVRFVRLLLKVVIQNERSLFGCNTAIHI